MGFTEIEAERKRRLEAIEAEHHRAFEGLRRERQEAIYAADRAYRDAWDALAKHHPHEASVDQLPAYSHAARRHDTKWAVVMDGASVVGNRLFEKRSDATAWLKTEFPYAHGHDGFCVVRVAVVPLYDGIIDFLSGGL